MCWLNRLSEEITNCLKTVRLIGEARFNHPLPVAETWRRLLAYDIDEQFPGSVPAEDVMRTLGQVCVLNISQPDQVCDLWRGDAMMLQVIFQRVHLLVALLRNVFPS